LTVVGQNFPAGRGEPLPMLLKASQHREIALIEYRTAVPLDIAGARALLLFGTTVLRDGCARNENYQKGSGKGISRHKDLSAGD
jgi:hypothetical protein